MTPFCTKSVACLPIKIRSWTQQSIMSFLPTSIQARASLFSQYFLHVVPPLLVPDCFGSSACVPKPFWMHTSSILLLRLPQAPFTKTSSYYLKSDGRMRVPPLPQIFHWMHFDCCFHGLYRVIKIHQQNYNSSKISVLPNKCHKPPKNHSRLNRETEKQ